MRIIDETIANDLSGNSNIYTPITDLTSIPGAQIGEIDVNGSTQAYAHVSLSSFTDYDTFRTDLTAGEKYRLVFTPDDESKFYANAVAWAQDASGSDSELIMNLIGSGSTYINGSLYSEVFQVAASGAHYFSFQLGVSSSVILNPVIAQLGYTLTLERIGPKLITGTADPEWLVGSDGSDRITGLGGNDTLLGNDGRDTLDGGAGSDVQDGGSGKDVLLGFGGNDRLLGGDSDDRLAGGKGADTLDGGAGHDMLTGSTGADTFRFADAPGSANADTITDFNIKADQIALSSAAFTAFTDTGLLDAAAFVQGTAALTADQHIIYNRANGQIFYDADGVGGADKLLIATVTAGLNLGAGDFLIY